MLGRDVRAARISAGMTQNELAASIGVSQSFVSAVENGRRGIAVEIEDRLRRSLKENFQELPMATEAQGDATTWAATTWAATTLESPGLPLPLHLRLWERRQPSGDTFGCLPLFGGAVLVAAVDIAGHGAEAVGPAAHLTGWMRGWSYGLATTPTLQSCVTALKAGLSVSSAQASWFLALLTPAGPHHVEYAAASYGFPAPLLMLDDSNQTLESTSGEHVLRHERVPAPWKLVVASDGLLERLGAGDERRGKRSLLRWNSSRTRNQPAADRLDPGGPPMDDETLLVVEWNGWDLDLTYDNSRPADRNRVEETVDRWTGAWFGDTEQRRLRSAVGEALDNADEHGYAQGRGVVRVQARDEGTRIRIQVHDQGLWRGEPIDEGGGFTCIRAAVTNATYVRVYPNGLQLNLTRSKPERTSA